MKYIIFLSVTSLLSHCCRLTPENVTFSHFYSDLRGVLMHFSHFWGTHE